MIVADTDVLVDFLAGIEPATSRLIAFAESGRLQTTVINSFELLSGARSGPAADKIRKLIASIIVVPLEQRAAERAAQVRRTLEGKGETIGMADSLIAGIALAFDLPLFTGDRKHFERVDQLELVKL